MSLDWQLKYAVTFSMKDTDNFKTLLLLLLLLLLSSSSSSSLISVGF
jgi:hypothetical protein